MWGHIDIMADMPLSNASKSIPSLTFCTRENFTSF